MGTLAEGAGNAVDVCMAVRNGEHVLILTDRATFDVGDAISKAAHKRTKGNVKLLILEDYTERPAKELPKPILDLVPWANVSFYAAASQRENFQLEGRSSGQR